MAKVIEKTISPGEIQSRLISSISFKNSYQFPEKWAAFERFKGGDQWPVPTARTKHLARCVFNIIEKIENHKVSTVMSEHINVVFAGETVPEVGEEETDQNVIDYADKFTKFDTVTWEEAKLDESHEEILDTASNLGCGFSYTYLDNEVTGGSFKDETFYQGALRVKEIDPMNIHFGNPQNRKIENQPWIILDDREDVQTLRDIAKSVGLDDLIVNLIQPDREITNDRYDMAQIEVNPTESTEGKANLYTMFFKKRVTVQKPGVVDPKTGLPTMYMDSEYHIFYCKATKNVMIVPPTDTKKKLYPIAAMNWNKRKRSIYGKGDTEGIIPNQRCINLLCSMQVNYAQAAGFPKMRYKDGAVDVNKITNAVGELIKDKSKGGNWGVDYMIPGQMSAGIPGLVDSFINYTKDLLGANDAVTGDMSSGQLNAQAIMLLQKASGVPIESIKRRFRQFVEDEARIREEFYKVDYDKQRIAVIKDEDGNDMNMPFKGSEAADTNFRLKVDVGENSTYSEAYTIQSLDKFHDSGEMDLTTYLTFVPSNYVPYKDKWLKIIQKQQDQQVEQQKQQVLSAMNPTELAAFNNLPPDQQDQALAQMITEMQQAQAQQPQGKEQPQSKEQSNNSLTY